MDTLDARSLPPGFGFHPTDVELLSHYLKRKIMGYKTELEVIPVVDIYKYEPWDLPDKTRVQSGDCKWHFFNTRDRKYPTSSRTNRATKAGYWKSTGKDRVIRSRNRAIGTKKTLVFHKGRPPRGRRTDWIMHEFYLQESEYEATAARAKELFVLCRVTKRDGVGSGDGEEGAHIENATSQCQKNSPSTPEDTSDLKEHSVVESSGLEDQNIEAWVDELYDPNYSAVPSATGCKIELEEMDHGSFAPTEQLLPLNDGISSCVEGGEEQYYSQELDESWRKDLPYWSNHDENYTNWGSMVDDVTLFFTPRPNITDNHEFGFPECYPEASETGIVIRQRELRAFENVPNQRIKMQVHRMEAKNPVAVNHTVRLESKDHHLHMSEQPPEPAIFTRSAAPAGREGDGVKRETLYEDLPDEAYVDYCTTKGVKGASSGRFRSSIKGLVRRFFEEAHGLTRRYTPIGMNCFFSGLA